MYKLLSLVTRAGPARYQQFNERTPMSVPYQASSAVMECLRVARESLAELIPRLHEANVRCIESSKPLAKLAELSLQQRKEVAIGIRDANREWEEVTALIQKAIEPLDSI